MSVGLSPHAQGKTLEDLRKKLAFCLGSDTRMCKTLAVLGGEQTRRRSLSRLGRQRLYPSWPKREVKIAERRYTEGKGEAGKGTNLHRPSIQIQVQTMACRAVCELVT